MYYKNLTFILISVLLGSSKSEAQKKEAFKIQKTEIEWKKHHSVRGHFVDRGLDLGRGPNPVRPHTTAHLTFVPLYREMQ